jgi:hypothetical protein
MSIKTRTIDDKGPSFAFDLIPITTSCCPMASTPALNCATLVRSKQLMRPERENQLHAFIKMFKVKMKD